MVRRRVVAAIMLAAALSSGCSAEAARPAITRISDLLELRRDDVRDPAAYEEYLADADLAAELASGSGEPTGTPQVPEYEPPYLTAETTSTADVAVVWKASDDFPGWPAVTVFILSLDDGRWLVIDAFEATSAPEPLEPAATD